MYRPDLADPARRTIPRLLRDAAAAVGDAEYLVEEGLSRTYAQVDDLADRHANAYRALGVGTGDVVTLLMHNSVDMATTSFGINRLGAVWSPISVEYRGEWLGELLHGAASDVLVLDGDLWPSVRALPSVGFRHVVVRGDEAAVAQVRAEAPAGCAVHHLAEFDVAPATGVDVDLFYGDTNAVLWTSGTTGRSKGVMQSHNVWVEYCSMQNEQWRSGVLDGERFYCCLPMYNSGGWLMNIYPALLTGTAACIDQRFSASSFWDRVRLFGANHSIVLGTMQLYLMQQPPRPDDADNPIRTLVMMPVIQQLLEPFMTRFGVQTVGAGFGQSEIMGATLYRSDWPLSPSSCGYAVDTAPVETRLLDEFDNEVAVGEVGEFCVRPRRPFTIFNGYYREPDRTVEAFRNLWHHTGDLGRRNADGELFFADRKKDSLRHKGRNTATFEVEHIARKFDGIVEVAAVGVRVEEMAHEEELLVLIQPRDGVTIDPLEFCQYMDAHAPYFFVPRYVAFVDEFPMTPTNKIQKYRLRDRGLPKGAWDLERDAGGWRPSR